MRNAQGLSERDILMKLVEKVEGLERSVSRLIEQSSEKDIALNKIGERLSTVEQMAEENSKFRSLVYAALIEGSVGVAGAIATLVSLLNR